jgi:hypothetical protein
MELLLNLVWLLLALPAYGLWRRTRGAHPRGSITSLQCSLALGCALFLLFPVVSATDDLHAMRAESEEPGTSKRSVRQAGNEKASGWNTRWQNPPAISTVKFLFAPGGERGLELVTPSATLPVDPALSNTSRSPPQARLG